MEELIKKLKEAGKLEVLKSEEELRAAVKELGYSDEDFEKMLTEVSLADDVLEQVAGGYGPGPNTKDEWEDLLNNGSWTPLERVIIEAAASRAKK